MPFSDIGKLLLQAEAMGSGRHVQGECHFLNRTNEAKAGVSCMAVPVGFAARRHFVPGEKEHAGHDRRSRRVHIRRIFQFPL
jgi:hypothetical protein